MSVSEINVVFTSPNFAKQRNCDDEKKKNHREKAKKQLRNLYWNLAQRSTIRWTFLINIHDLAVRIFIFRMVDFASFSLLALKYEIITVPLTVLCSFAALFHFARVIKLCLWVIITPSTHRNTFYFIVSREITPRFSLLNSL